MMAGIWLHWLAAALYAGFVLSQAASWRDRAGRALLAAGLAMAVWAGVSAWRSIDAPVAQLAESARNMAWLVFLHMLLVRSGSEYRSLRALYAVLAFVVGGTAVIDLLNTIDPTRELPAAPLLASAFALRMVFAVGALVAVHNLYVATAAGARSGIGLPLAALGVLWGVDLTFYALNWASGSWSHEFAAARAGAAAALVPLLAIGARRNASWSIRLSRTVTFQSVAFVAALAYLAFVVAAAFTLQQVGGRYAEIVPPIVLLVSALAVALVLASPRRRAWANVMLAKHLFEHRYDYRAEWLRFTGTLGLPGPDADPLDVRVVKAIADIVQSPGGVLMVPANDGMVGGARWRWETLHLPADGTDRTALATVLAAGRIVELDALRAGRGEPEEDRAVPEWMLAEPAAFALVPLVHLDRLVGAVLLERPPLARALDWEDFDLLRLAGRQVASYLAEARTQEALSEAARFDEFNRRFAFIMHDIKNLASQLTLVARNAERHAENPAFRVDMIATLNASTARMNELLARLSQHNRSRAEEPRLTGLHAVASAVAAQHRARHPVIVAGNESFALADPARLEKALSHLVHNAIDASPPAEPVTVTLVTRGMEVGIEVADCGPGMSAEFVSGTLFKPFASTKAGGFGIGAYEARALVEAMGGRLTVASTPKGTRMTIWLPAAEPEIRKAAA